MKILDSMKFSNTETYDFVTSNKSYIFIFGPVTHI